jgi:hypothetical protein
MPRGDERGDEMVVKRALLYHSLASLFAIKMLSAVPVAVYIVRHVGLWEG